MKKIICSLLALALTLMFIPCNVANAEEATAKPIEASVAEAVTESRADVWSVPSGGRLSR